MFASLFLFLFSFLYQCHSQSAGADMAGNAECQRFDLNAVEGELLAQHLLKHFCIVLVLGVGDIDVHVFGTAESLIDVFFGLFAHNAHGVVQASRFGKAVQLFALDLQYRF